MGADIHMYLERRKDPSLPWELDPNHVEDDDGTLAQISCTHRNYELFGVLAGVRSMNDPLYPVRGLPTDITDILKKEFNEHGDHTPHWLTISEFIKCLRKAKCDPSPHDRDDVLVFDWQKYGWSNMPGYWSIVRYAARYVQEAQVDNILLGTKYRPEVRLVFWFDS